MNKVRTSQFLAVVGVLALCGSAWSVESSESIQGMISHWKFDEGSGTTAYDSAGSNDGTIYGASWLDGIIDGALDFDGSGDYVDAPTTNFNVNVGTISMWFKQRFVANYGIWNMYNYDSDRMLIWYFGSVTQKWRFRRGGSTILESTNTYLDTNWHHITVTYDFTNDNYSMYIDGVHENSSTIAYSAPTLTSSQQIGKYDHSSVDRFFNGAIDDVRIYNRALSAEEIWQLYRGELADLVGLEIVGPGEVAENFSASYKAIAHYDDDSTGDVTNLAEWAVEPNTAANIDENGVLTTKDVVEDQPATILASYTEGDVTVEAEKAIDILAICPTGTALNFDGVDDYVEVGDIGVTGDWTVEFWAELDTVAPDIQYPIGTGLGAASRPAGIFMAYSKAEDGRWGIYDGVSYHVGSVVSAGVWYHVAVTKSGTTYTLYLNGNFENDVSLADIDIGNLQIGRRSDNRWYVDGLIDEVRIYNRALSAEEIRGNMYTRLAGDEPNLIAYWDFDEGEGQVVYDLSGNGNDGQLGSTPNPDVSDPAWVESDAPIGICNLYKIATKAAERAVERKTALLEELLAALAEEWTAYEALEELLESGDYGDLNYGDIVKAKQKIHSATQHEEQSIDALEKSIEKLQDALSALGYEP